MMRSPTTSSISLASYCAPWSSWPGADDCLLSIGQSAAASSSSVPLTSTLVVLFVLQVRLVGDTAFYRRLTLLIFAGWLPPRLWFVAEPPRPSGLHDSMRRFDASC